MTNNTLELDNQDTQKELPNIQLPDNATDKFRLPIQYNKHKQQLSSVIIKDLELYKLYEILLSPKTTHDYTVMKDLVEYYTTDIEFLQDTQSLVSKYEIQPQITSSEPHYSSVLELIKEIELDNYFTKYGLIDYSAFHFINTMDYVLLFLTLYTLISPIIYISTPMIMFALPFFILQFKHQG